MIPKTRLVVSLIQLLTRRLPTVSSLQLPRFALSSRRVLKAAEAIREVVGMAILADLRDPRIEHVTVTRVEVSADMRNARVYVSVMGAESKQQLAIKGLESSAGFLQSKIANRIDTRYTPRLQFKLDDGVKKSIAIAQMLADVLPESETDGTPESDSDLTSEEPRTASTEPDGN